MNSSRSKRAEIGFYRSHYKNPSLFQLVDIDRDLKQFFKLINWLVIRTPASRNTENVGRYTKALHRRAQYDENGLIVEAGRAASQ